MATTTDGNDLAFLTDAGISIDDKIKQLKYKSIVIPVWNDLQKEYDKKQHPVFADPNYKDEIKSTGEVTKVSRIGLSLQKLAADRMTELTFGIPVKRIYKATTPDEQKAAKILEKIYLKNRIDSVNIDRGTSLFASCEFATLWYAVAEQNSIYGEPSPLKLRCKTYSPMNGDFIYPLFDDNDDLIALSFLFSRSDGDKTTQYFDTFTANRRIRWALPQGGGGWEEEINEEIKLGKIPAVYCYRPTPIWEDTSNEVSEIEWTLSRNGNYIRKNGKPLFALFADKEIKYGGGNENDSLAVRQFPQGSSAQYITWSQSVDSIKLQIDNIYKAFFTQLQLPDMSFDSMKTTPMSGEARKMMFVDAYLKVLKERGRLLESLDREMNVIREYAKIMFPQYSNAFETLSIEQSITPYTISDDKETIGNLMTATGGKPIISQKEGVEFLGWSDDVEATMQQLQDENMSSITQPTL
jgi:hypothetical protein